MSSKKKTYFITRAMNPFDLPVLLKFYSSIVKSIPMLLYSLLTSYLLYNDKSKQLTRLVPVFHELHAPRFISS